MSATAWTIITLLWVVVIGLIFVVVALARQVGILHERIRPAGALHIPKGLKVGEAAPVIETADLSTGRALSIGTPTPHGRATLVAFVSPTCPVCKSLLPALRSMRRGERIEVILASDGVRQEHLDFIAAESLQEFPYVLSEQLGVTYGASKLPYAVLVDGAGVVRANGLVNTREHLESLLEAQALGVANLQELAVRERREVA